MQRFEVWVSLRNVAKNGETFCQPGIFGFGETQADLVSDLFPLAFVSNLPKLHKFLNNCKLVVIQNLEK